MTFGCKTVCACPHLKLFRVQTPNVNPHLQNVYQPGHQTIVSHVSVLLNEQKLLLHKEERRICRGMFYLNSYHFPGGEGAYDPADVPASVGELILDLLSCCDIRLIKEQIKRKLELK